MYVMYNSPLSKKHGSIRTVFVSALKGLKAPLHKFTHNTAAHHTNLNSIVFCDFICF